jgi:hypothetical protein
MTYFKILCQHFPESIEKNQERPQLEPESGTVTRQLLLSNLYGSASVSNLFFASRKWGDKTPGTNPDSKNFDSLCSHVPSQLDFWCCNQ